MSTPISRGSKLEGFSLYAPRRVREGPTDSELAAPPMSQEPENARMRDAESAMREPDNDWMQERDGQGGSSEAEADDVQDRLEQAIREAIELGRTSDNDDAEDAPDAAFEAENEISRSPALAFPSRHRPVRQDRGEVEMGRPGRGEPQVSSRLRSLDPEIVPEPRAAMPRNGVVGPLVRFSLLILFAAIIAYGVTKLSSWTLGDRWIKGTSDRVATIASDVRAPPAERAPVESLPPSRLVVDDQQAFTNEPLPLTVVVEHPRQDEVLLFSGLAPGTRLSVGTSTSASAWRLSPDELKGLQLYAPKDFVGVMNTAVDLIGADNRLLDSRAVQLKWSPKQTNPAPVTPPAPATVLATAGDQTGVGAPRAAAVEPIDPSEVDFLMQQGRQALGGGDISAARVAFRRLADAGIAEAALALAETYDPIYLGKHNVIGLLGDRATAKELYQRARQLGSTEAERMLAQLGGN